jgi:hypothetical protein
MTNINVTDLVYSILLYTAVSNVLFAFACKIWNEGNYRKVLNNFLLCLIFPPASPFYIVSRSCKMKKKQQKIKYYRMVSED